MDGKSGTQRAAVTVLLPRDEVQRLWQSAEHPTIDEAGAGVTFADAPGDRGTEIHVDVETGGKLGEIVKKVAGSEPPLARAKDELRRFKQLAETGEVPRSDATPEGESFGRKRDQRAGQPA